MRTSTNVGLVLGAIGLTVAVAFLVSPVSVGQGAPPGGGTTGGGGGPPGTGTTGGGAGGHYTGPNDTVPPNGGGPCAPGTCPSLTPCGPVTSGGPCDANWSMTAATMLWADPCPEFINRQGYVKEIKIGDIKQLCSSPTAGVIDICLQVPCVIGTEAVCVWESISFRHFGNGVPDALGNCLPICGMNYGFKVQDAGGGPWYAPPCSDAQCGLNQDKYILNCASLQKVVLQVDCNCFNQILAQYQAAGLYSPSGATFLNDTSVVFVVQLFCCMPQ